MKIDPEWERHERHPNGQTWIGSFPDDDPDATENALVILAPVSDEDLCGEEPVYGAYFDSNPAYTFDMKALMLEILRRDPESAVEWMRGQAALCRPSTRNWGGLSTSPQTRIGGRRRVPASGTKLRRVAARRLSGKFLNAEFFPGHLQTMWPAPPPDGLRQQHQQKGDDRVDIITDITNRIITGLPMQGIQITDDAGRTGIREAVQAYWDAQPVVAGDTILEYDNPEALDVTLSGLTVDGEPATASDLIEDFRLWDFLAAEYIGAELAHS